MKSILFILCLMPSSFLWGQVLTKAEAKAFADELYAVEMLSENGLEVLKHRIEENKFNRHQGIDPNTGAYLMSNDLRPSQILTFLSEAFYGDFMYRSGILEQQDFLRKMMVQLEGQEPSEEVAARIDMQLDSILENSEGYKIEEAIAPEDDWGDHMTQFTISPFGASFSASGLIHHKRSVAGKTCTRTLNDLLTISLIDEPVFNEVKAKLDSKELDLELYLLAYATERAAFYEDLEGNKERME